jgi:hypothetical protein
VSDLTAWCSDAGRNLVVLVGRAAGAAVEAEIARQVREADQRRER